MNSKLHLFIILIVFSSISTKAGIATYYSEAFTKNTQGVKENCGFMWLPPAALTHHGAIQKPAGYEAGKHCGRCAIAKCIDSRCGTYKKEVKFMIIESCPPCKNAEDIEFSRPAWNDITNNASPGIYKMDWEYADCDGEFIDGNIRMNMDKGANVWYASLQFINTIVGVKSARIGRTMDSLEELPRKDDNFFAKSLTNNLEGASYFYVEFTDWHDNKFSNKMKDFTPGKLYVWPMVHKLTGGAVGDSTGGTTTDGPTASDLKNSGKISQSGKAFTSESGAKNKNCGFMWVPPGARTHYAAASKKFEYNKAGGCGRCALVQCADPRCGDYRKAVQVMIVDSCSGGGCGEKDLSISKDAWAEVTNGYKADVFQATWKWTDCDGTFIDGNIRMGMDKGANIYYASLDFSNTKVGIKSARIGMTVDTFEELKRKEDNYWVKSLKTPLKNMPYYVEFTDLNDNTYKNKFTDFTAGKVYEWDIASKASPNATPNSSSNSSSSSPSPSFSTKSILLSLNLIFIVLFAIIFY